MKKVLLIIMMIGVVAPISGVLAATEQTIGGNVSAKITPSNPLPHSLVTITLESYDVDLNRSQITWFINGKREQSGLGFKIMAKSLGGAGEEDVWRILISSPDGRQIEKIITFRPASVDLLWQAETYTPFWYQGKALPSSESRVKMVAIAYILKNNSQPYRPEELIFTWYKDGKIMSQSSGAGRDSFTFISGKILAQDRIKVKVSTINNLTTAEKETVVRIREPQVLVYFDNPLTGPVTNQSLSARATAPNPLFTLLAEPFFFSLADLADNQIEFDWRVNDQSLTSRSGNPRAINFRVGSIDGQGLVKLNISNKRSIYQSGRYEGVINFRAASDNLNF